MRLFCVVFGPRFALHAGWLLLYVLAPFFLPRALLLFRRTLSLSAYGLSLCTLCDSMLRGTHLFGACAHALLELVSLVGLLFPNAFEFVAQTRTFIAQALRFVFELLRFVFEFFSHLHKFIAQTRKSVVRAGALSSLACVLIPQVCDLRPQVCDLSPRLCHVLLPVSLCHAWRGLDAVAVVLPQPLVLPCVLLWMPGPSGLHLVRASLPRELICARSSRVPVCALFPVCAVCALFLSEGCQELFCTLLLSVGTLLLCVG